MCYIAKAITSVNRCKPGQHCCDQCSSPPLRRKVDVMRPLRRRHNRLGVYVQQHRSTAATSASIDSGFRSTSATSSSPGGRSSPPVNTITGIWARLIQAPNRSYRGELDRRFLLGQATNLNRDANRCGSRKRRFDRTRTAKRSRRARMSSSKFRRVDTVARIATTVQTL